MHRKEMKQMKYNVLKPFRDKNTKKRYKKNDLYETKDENRAAELQEKGFISTASQKTVKRKTPKKSEE